MKPTPKFSPQTPEEDSITVSQISLTQNGTDVKLIIGF